MIIERKLATIPKIRDKKIHAEIHITIRLKHGPFNKNLWISITLQLGYEVQSLKFISGFQQFNSQPSFFIILIKILQMCFKDFKVYKGLINV